MYISVPIMHNYLLRTLEYHAHQRPTPERHSCQSWDTWEPKFVGNRRDLSRILDIQPSQFGILHTNNHKKWPTFNFFLLVRITPSISRAFKLSKCSQYGKYCSSFLPTSPGTETVAPKTNPRNSVPSSRTNVAFRSFDSPWAAVPIA